MTDQTNFRNPVEQLGYAMMPHAVMQDPNISDGAKVTYSIYIRHAQQKGSCFPGIKTMARIRGKSTGTISRHNEELEQAGYIARKRVTGTSTLTIIEDVRQIERLQGIATSEIARREKPKKDKYDIAIIEHVKLQECDVEEEQTKNNKQEKPPIIPKKELLPEALIENHKTEPHPLITGTEDVKPRGAARASPSQAMFSALGTAYRFDLKLLTSRQRGRLNAVGKRIRDAEYAVDEVLNAGMYWWTEDWRGQRGSTPTDSQFFETLSKLRQGNKTMREAESW